MELKKGFKQTEIGTIPKDWDIFYLSDCSDKITDGEHQTPRRCESGYYLLSARNIHNGRIDLSDVDYVPEDEYLRIRKRCNPDSGDILISCSGTIGRVATVPSNLKCVMVRSAALIKPSKNKLDGKYAQYFLQTGLGQSQIFSSLNQGAQANLFLGHIQNLKIALPKEKKEQEAIANALSDADAYIESLEKLIAKKRLIKKGVMQELLTGKIRLNQFGVNSNLIHTQFGNFPSDWKIRTIRELGLDISDGNYSSKYPSSSDFKLIGIPFIRANNIKNFQIDENDMRFISINQHNELLKGHLKRNDILITTRGEIGQIAIVQEDYIGANINAQIVRMNVDKQNLYYKFIAQVLDSIYVQKQFENLQTGSALKQLPVNKLLNLCLVLPSFNEQVEIADYLFDLHLDISLIENNIQKARLIKQGMMQELLTGRIRLV